MSSSRKVEALVVRRHLALTLEHVNLHVGLAIHSSEQVQISVGTVVFLEIILVITPPRVSTPSDRGVTRAEGCPSPRRPAHHPEWQRHHHHFIGVHGLVRILAAVCFTRSSTPGRGWSHHHRDFIQLVADSLASFGLLHRDAAAVDQVGGQLFELGAGEGEIQCQFGKAG